MKDVVLGTAMWGWSLQNQLDAWKLLDYFIEKGFSLVDTAINYPIDGNSEHMGLALNWLKTWSKANPKQLKLMVKLGSINNAGTPDADLRSEVLINQTQQLLNDFEESLWGIAVHWDNRNSQSDVDDTIYALRYISDCGLRIGLSGISHPDLYYQKVQSFQAPIILQVKENLFDKHIRAQYTKYFKRTTFWAYGINFGGLSLTGGKQETFSKRNIQVSDSIRKLLSEVMSSNDLAYLQLKNNYDLSLIEAITNPALGGLILGSRTVDQLKQSIDRIRRTTDLGGNVYKDIHRIINQVKLLGCKD